MASPPDSHHLHSSHAHACKSLKGNHRQAGLDPGCRHWNCRLTGAGAGAEAERAAEVSGAWLALAQVAALDPSAPSWEFLQVAYRPSPAA